ALALRRAGPTGALLLAAGALLGALRAHELPPRPDDVAAFVSEGALTVEARIAEEPRRWAPDRLRLLLEVEAVVTEGERRPATGRALVTIYGEAPALGEDQRIAADLRLHAPVGYRNPGGFDYPAQLRREGIALVGSGRADRVRPLTADAPPWPARLQRGPGLGVDLRDAQHGRCLAPRDGRSRRGRAGGLRPRGRRAGLGAARDHHGTHPARRGPARARVPAPQCAGPGRARASRVAAGRPL